MTDEELKEKLEECISDCYVKPYQEVVANILTLIREADYRSPEEVDKMVEHRIYEMYANETYQP